MPSTLLRIGQQRSERSFLSFRRFAAVYAGLLAVATIPLWLCDILPLFDYPNHLARLYLLVHLQSSPTLRQFYALAWHPLPNLAMDLLVPPLLGVLSLETAGRLFVVLVFVLMTAGANLLHRALFGRWSLWPCLAFLLLYNRILIWGFLNYLFGVGLLLCVFAGWIALRDRPMVLRLAVGLVFAIALFFAHLMALGIYGLLVAGFELGRWRRARWGLGEALMRLLVAGLPFLPPLAIMLLAVPAGEGGGIAFTAPWRKVDLLFSVFDTYNRPFDVACFVIVVLGIVVAVVRRWLRLAPEIAVPLALLLVAYLVMPSQLMTASGADRRLPVVLALLVVAGTRWVSPGTLVHRSFLGAALFLFLIRLGEIAYVWHGSAAAYDAALGGLDRIAPGSRLAIAYPDAAVNAVATPLVHLPTLAIARREAFVPTLFAYPTQQPVALRPDWRAVADALSPQAVWDAFLAHRPLADAQRAALQKFDYVVFLDRKPFDMAAGDGLTPVYVDPRFKLYRLPPVP